MIASLKLFKATVSYLKNQYQKIIQSKMFRQTLVLFVCLIALAVGNEFIWFGIGSRVDGDQNISNQTAQTFETEFPTTHKINLLFYGGESTFTHARFVIEEVSFVIFK